MPAPNLARPEREDAEAITVVGLGGSAGSISALQSFFENLPLSETGYGSAYVVVLHLSADYESHLPEVLRRSSNLPVHQVNKTVHIERDNVYVIPPGKHMEMRDNTLELHDPEPTPGRRIAIDTFFRTLAAAHGPQAAAVIFSGTGADGTLGIRQIKESGGLVVAQSPSEAEYDAMPRSAIATGLVDYVLPAMTMPAQIATYWQTSRVMRIPEEAAPSPEQREEGVNQEVALYDILTHVREQTGHDFAFYKRATVLRRIGRRMQVNGLVTLAEYRDFLRLHATELNGLIADLLISVTQFFRDPEAWDALERDVVPGMFADKSGSEAEIRAWVCACATGEEAYTLAILLLEQAERMPHPPSIQVFATDMDAQAIARARTGIYPETIVGDITEERLRRWFYHQDGFYQIRKEIREIVLFAHHDVLRDTPFSRLNLVTCRNLFIYLTREAQGRVFNTFHFALKSHGHLMLGPSESAEGTESIFGATNKNFRLFVRQTVGRSALPSLPTPMFVPNFPRGSQTEGHLASEPEYPRSRRGLSSFGARGATRDEAFTAPQFLPTSRGGMGGGGNAIYISRELLPRYGPPVAVVTEDYLIVHLSGRISDFLLMPEGEPTLNLMELVLPDIRPELRGALFAVVQENTEQVRVVRNSTHEHAGIAATRLSVRPVPASLAADAPRYFVVQFEAISESILELLRPLLSELPSAEPASGGRPEASTTKAAQMNAARAAAEVARRLEQENASLQQDLRISSEQYDVITEELKASNEEMQATNEEMRSVVEELETGKEELQSVNEELSTVNYELKARVEELTATNNDLSNFLGATDIATLFLDRVLNVKRFTSASLILFNLIPTDIGRPLSHVTNRLDYPALEEDAKAVLARLIPVEREVTSADGQHDYLVRLLPYRSLEDRIEGVVVNFVDITARKRAEEITRQSEARLQAAINIETVGVIFFNNDFEIADCNEAYVRMSGWTRDEIRGGHFGWEFFTPQEFIQPSRRALEEINTRGITTPYEKEYIRKDGSRFWALFACKRISDNEIVEFVIDIADQKRAEAIVRESEERYRLFVNASSDILYRMSPDWSQMHSLEGKEFLADTETPSPSWLGNYIPDSDKLLAQAAITEAIRTKKVFELEHRVIRADGTLGWVFSRAVPLLDARGDIVEWFGVASDITERKEAEEALRESRKRLRLALDASQMGTFSYHVAEDRSEPDARMLELFGLPEGSALNLVTALTKMIHPDDRERYAQAVARSVSPDSDGALNEEIRVIHPDGTLHCIVITAQTLFAGEPPRATLMSGLAADITARKQAEEALRESDERLRIAVAAAQLATWDWNLPANTVRWNARHFAILGLPPDDDHDVRPELLLESIHPEDRERIAAQLEESAATGRIFDVEFRIVRYDNGEVCWMAGYGAVVQTGPDGRATRISGVMSDITERKRAEEALRRSEESFRTLSDVVPQIIWTNTPDGTANYFNSRWYEYTRLTYEQSAGPGWQAVVHPDDEPASVERWNRALAMGEIFGAEYRLRGADGTYRWFLGRNVPLKDAAGTVTAWFGSATDIEDLKQAQAARQESEERFRLLVEGARDYAMFLLDPNGRITFWSAGAERVFGWDVSEALGQMAEMIFTPEDREQDAAVQEMATAREHGRALDRRWHLRRDGSRFWADGILMRLDDEAGNVRGFAKVARDATDQKRAEEAVQLSLATVAEANDQLEQHVQERTQSLEERTEELSDMSDMRQELLRQLVSAQEQERGRISRDLHDDTGQIVTALLLELANLKDMPPIIGDISLQERIEYLQSLAGEVAQKSHRLSFTLRPTDLDDIGLIGALRNYTEEWSHWSGLPVSVENIGVDGTDERLPREVETTIYRVAQEALTNILRYAAGRGVAPDAAASHVDILVQRRHSESTGFNVLTVIEDDGPGFDVEAVLNRPPGERRLGIFGMQERARLAGGSLDIESTLGQGTAVYLQIPLPPQ